MHPPGSHFVVPQVALATLLSFLFAELSYRLIERPALRL